MTPVTLQNTNTHNSHNLRSFLIFCFQCFDDVFVLKFHHYLPVTPKPPGDIVAHTHTDTHTEVLLPVLLGSLGLGH